MKIEVLMSERKTSQERLNALGIGVNIPFISMISKLTLSAPILQNGQTQFLSVIDLTFLWCWHLKS